MEVAKAFVLAAGQRGVCIWDRTLILFRVGEGSSSFPVRVASS